jgi:hypothetical protein
VDLDDFIVATYCLIDETVPTILGGRRLRQRGPQPILADSEVLTMEVVGEFLGYDQDQAIYRYFRRYYAHFFPALAHLHRTTFVRQAANLWALKDQLWHQLVVQERADPVSIVDSVPISVCAFARARWCRRFGDTASYGRDHSTRQTFYGFRLHVRCDRSGRIEAMSLAGADQSDLALLPEIVPPRERTLLADRNYWSPDMTADLAPYGLVLAAPFRQKTYDPDPQRSAILGKRRWRIESTFAQLVERYHLNQVWARDLWHFGNRLVRKVLSHTIAMHLNTALGNPPLRLALLLT